MLPAATTTLDVVPPPTASPSLAPPATEAQLRETLKRCSPATLDAALRFHRTADLECLPAIIRGVIERYVGREHRPKLENAPASLRLIEDLGIDSLTMMEIVMLAEEVLPVSLSNDELRHLRTLGDIEGFIAGKLQGRPTAPVERGVGWHMHEVRTAHEAAEAATVRANRSA